jgi:hypothetical protein
VPEHSYDEAHARHPGGGAGRRVYPARMTEPELTDTMIEAAMLRAEKAGCPPGDARCSGFPYPAGRAPPRHTRIEVTPVAGHGAPYRLSRSTGRPKLACSAKTLSLQLATRLEVIVTGLR